MRDDIWVDGICFQNREFSPGGWAVILKDEAVGYQEISGASKNTTWYQMEMMAILRGIKLARSVREKLTKLVVHTDHIDSIRYVAEKYEISSEREKGIHHYLQEIEWAQGPVQLEFHLVDKLDSRNQRVTMLAKREVEALMKTLA
ncbi:reverse transcriptase-like protein [Candidatus Thorarchaeota archaeon]|nr:MAG: reverse transcriptase-like protein [Candidatus Thorarchaeota archaeon]